MAKINVLKLKFGKTINRKHNSQWQLKIYYSLEVDHKSADLDCDWCLSCKLISFPAKTTPPRIWRTLLSTGKSYQVFVYQTYEEHNSICLRDYIAALIDKLVTLWLVI